MLKKPAKAREGVKENIRHGLKTATMQQNFL